jgi:hypothetical protein
MEAVKKWIHTRCPVKSGTTYHIQLCTSDELWQEYLKAASMRQIVRPILPQ